MGFPSPLVLIIPSRFLFFFDFFNEPPTSQAAVVTVGSHREQASGVGAHPLQMEAPKLQRAGALAPGSARPSTQLLAKGCRSFTEGSLLCFHFLRFFWVFSPNFSSLWFSYLFWQNRWVGREVAAVASPTQGHGTTSHGPRQSGGLGPQ